MNDNTKTASTKDKAVSTWTHDDKAMLVHTLKMAKEKGDWGDNNPKTLAWTTCVKALSGSEKKSGGAPKVANVIKRRWQRVRIHHISHIVCVFTILPSAEARIQYIQEHARSIRIGMGQRKGYLKCLR